MSNPPPTEWAFDGAQVAVLADCHIHPGGGPGFPPALFHALAGVDLIVTLGDMGEAAGLDQLAAIAPVVGVRGADDSDDPRTANAALVLRTRGMDIGCVFDPVAVGLAVSADPFAPASDFNAAAVRVFGRPVQMLLFASTHKAADGKFGDAGVALNPGSAVLPVAGAKPSFVRMTLSDGRNWTGRIVHLD
jgi:Predicted phosphoesterase